jgi:hypothetical protein
MQSSFIHSKKKNVWFWSHWKLSMSVTNYYFPPCQDYSSFALMHTLSVAISRIGSEHSIWAINIPWTILSRKVGQKIFVVKFSHDFATPCQKWISHYSHCAARNLLVTFGISLDEQKCLSEQGWCLMQYNDRRGRVKKNN